jgi:hypothetical protein
MSNTTNNNIKRGRGRPRKESTIKAANKNENIDTGIPAFLEPNSHDIHDELARMDSYIYSQYNE